MSRPLCNTCAFYVEDFAGGSCEAPQNYDAPNLVTGARDKKWLRCKTMREHGWIAARVPGGLYASCGKEGRWFQPKCRPPESAK